MKVEEVKKSFEWYAVNPGDQFFDQVEKRFFINFTKQPIKIGFSHNARRLELIAIGEGDIQDPKIVALEGKEVIEE